MTFDHGAVHPADQTTVRRANLGVVLRHVASTGSRSRAQIAAETGLTRGTVSSLVSELIARDLLHETGETTSPRGIGRPGAALELSDVVVGVGLEVNVDYVAVSV
jgi:predicted ArsR family transcriptional regulator